MSETITNFVINRSKWRCGGFETDKSHGPGYTKLLNAQGFQCCLGFVCEQMGFELSDLLNKDYPANVGFVPFFTEKEADDFILDTVLTEKAIEINDNDKLTAAQREEALTKLFEEHGLTVTFIGEYEDAGN